MASQSSGNRSGRDLAESSETGSRSSTNSESGRQHEAAFESAGDQGRSSVPMSFLKSIASFKGDLASMTAPPFILSSKSLVEYSTYWAEHPALFVAPATEADPAKRSLLVLKWFLSTLKQQYCSRNEKLGSEKKPLNPFLGELFLGKWLHDGVGTTCLVSEQVSHHPPVTAYCIWNEKHGLKLQGYNGQEASFTGRTINVKQVGHALLHIDAFNEDHFITLPTLHIEGILRGAPYVELNGSSYIQSSSGYTSKIDYSGRGWIRGKRNSFTASVFRTGHEKDPLYTIDGQWNESFTLGDVKGARNLETFDTSSAQTTPLSLAPLDQQDPMESRRVWQKVAQAIERGDMEATSKEKSAVENAQRALRKKEKDESREWQRQFFRRLEKHNLDRFAKAVGETIQADKTNGVWEFDHDKARASILLFQ